MRLFDLKQKIKRRLLSRLVSAQKREEITSLMKNRLTNTRFSLISQNCIGGILSHELGLRFDSPTVNLYFEAPDFVNFCERLPDYLALPLTFLHDDPGYPVCAVGDVKMFFVHYPSFAECVLQWERRKQRVDYDNLCFIMTDRDGLTDSLLKRFMAISGKKVLFSHLPRPEYDFVVHIPGYERNGFVPELQDYCDLSGLRLYEKHFDFVGWLNDKGNKAAKWFAQ